MSTTIINPKELAKRTKESTRPVSLRIKERTWLGFEQLAKDNDTTPNALISELADYYIENLKDDSLNLSDSAVNFNKFKTAVEKETRKLCRWCTEDTALDAHMLYATDTYWDGRSRFYLESLRRVFKKACVYEDGSELANIESDFGISLNGSTTIYPTLKKEARYYTGAWDPQQPFQDMLYVPFEKYTDVFCLFKAVYKNTQKNKIQLEFDIDTIDKIVDCINHHDYNYLEEDTEIDDDKGEDYIARITYTSSGIDNKDDRQVLVKYNVEERRAMLTELAQIIIHAAENA